MKSGKLIMVIFLALAVSLSGCYAGPKYSANLEESFVLAKDWKQAREDIESAGGWIRHIFPDDNILIGDVPVNFKSSGVKKIYDRNSNVPSNVEDLFVSWTKMLDYNDLSLEEKLANNVPDVEPIYNDMIAIEKPSLDQLSIIPRGLPEGADPTDTSSFMIGDVSVSVIFPESDESSPNTEDWTDEEIAEVKAEIINAMNWWALREENAHLTFEYHYEERIPTQVEPIALPGSNPYFHCQWISDVLYELGHGDGDELPCSPIVYDYINEYRESNISDWGFTIFVVDSSNDPDGAFSDGFSAFSAMSSSGGGPYTVMTYDNGGYGISDMDAVAAHETGHIFGALDEYSCECDWHGGYLYYENQNCMDSCLIDELSIMGNGDIRDAFDQEAVDYYARGQVGWQDNNGDGFLDIVGLKPGITLNQYVLVEDDFLFDGNSWENIYSAINPNYNSFTINTIASVEYRYKEDDGEWTSWLNTSAIDGLFDSAQELYEFLLENLPGGDYTIQSKATNNVGNFNESDYQYITVTALPPMCEDSDGGFDIWVQGTLIDDYGSYTDECLDGNHLLEWFCGEDGTDASEVYCMYGCSLGRCMEKHIPKIRFTEHWPGHDEDLPY